MKTLHRFVCTTVTSTKAHLQCLKVHSTRVKVELTLFEEKRKVQKVMCVFNSSIKKIPHNQMHTYIHTYVHRYTCKTKMHVILAC